jgi:predicted ATPase/DNA-binding XRE family transcriptional regulator
MVTLAELVRQFRSDARLSQEDLAERAGLSPQTVSNIERGIAPSPRAITLSLLAEALGLDVDKKERLTASIRRQPAGLPPPLQVAEPFAVRGIRRLPPGPVRFIGREKELAACRALLGDADVRLVTVLGGAGVGKTSLALEIARTTTAIFDAGVLFVELSGVPDQSFVATKISVAAGVREAADGALSETIGAALGNRRALLVLDTFEGVIGAAPFVAELLVAAPSLTALVTSRSPLHLAAECRFPLAPLGRKAATELLVERIQALRPEFSVTPANAPSIAEVAQRLDDLPLAIELAAPLLKLMSPAALASRLEKRLPLLVAGPLDVPARQRTMRAALDWSYVLLSPDEAQLFRRLAVFRGAFSADAAASIGGSEGSTPLAVLRSLAVLVDHNLARVVDEEDTEPRFVCSDLVREYAAELLAASGERDATFARLAEYLTACARQFSTRDSSAQIASMRTSLAREAANFDAVLGWALDPAWVETGLRLAVALRTLWWFAGMLVEGSTWLRGLLEVAECRHVANDALLADAYAAAGGLEEARGDFVAAGMFQAKALPLKRKLGDLAGVAALLSGRAVAASQSGDYPRARELLTEGLIIRRALGDNCKTAESLVDLGTIAADEGNSLDAEALFVEALGYFREAENDLGIGFAFQGLARNAALHGAPDRAETFGMEGLRIGRLIRHTVLVASSTETLGWVAFQRGTHAVAESLFRESIELFVAMGDRVALPDVMEGLAATRNARGDACEAAQLLGRADAIRRRRRKDIVPVLRVRHDRLVETLRNALGAESFNAEWNIGSSS